MISNRKRNRLVCVSMLLLCWAVGSECVANVDIEEPIVRVSPARGDDDLFGYSVVLHQVAVPTDLDSAIQNSRIIVGAPKGTYPGGLALPASPTAENETGLVYQCSLTDESCSAVGRDGSNDANNRLFDGEADNTDLQNPDNFSHVEQKNGQLMGQLMKSSGDYFLACAPLWTPTRNIGSFIDNRRNIGRCFLSGRDLTEFVEVRPCRGSEPSANIISGDNRCQAGFGALLFDEGGTTRLVMSAPGSFTGVGRLYQYNNVSTLTTDISLADQSTDGPSTLGFDPMDSAAFYDGWSLSTGNLQGDPDTVDAYISSMPRFDLNTLTGRVNVRTTNLGGFTDPPILLGQQPGEYFGHSLITADLNSDGFDEIIVGAPMYSSESPAQTENGRVHIFVNDGQGNFNESATIILTGEEERGRFGHSIVNLGDINGDEIEDIAISAPYQSIPDDPNSSGVVYIYYGDQDNVISREPNQAIRAIDIREKKDLSELRSFGFSLGAQVDVDFNGYSDLVIGAYDSQTAVLLRTLSVARINFNLTTSTESVDLISDSNFTVTLCATYNGRGLTGRPLDVSFTLFEVVNGGGERVSMGDYNGMLNFPSTDVRTCDSVTIGLVPIDDITATALALQEPIGIEVEFNAIPRILKNSTTQLTDFRDFPLIRETGDDVVEVTPTLSCTVMFDGSEACKPDLSVTVTRVEYTTDSGMTYQSIVAGAVRTVRFVLSVRNEAGDPAINAMLNFTLPSEPFITGASAPSGQQVSCSAVVGSSREYDCSLPTFIRGNSGFEVTIEWGINPNNLNGTEPDVTATFIVGLPFDSIHNDNVTDNNQDQTDLTITAITNPQVLLTVAGPQTYSVMPALPRAQIRTLSDLGETVDIRVRASNTGPSTVPRAQLNISIPVRTPDGQFYLYVGEVQTIGPNIVCENMAIENPDNFVFQNRRRRRSPVVRSKRQAAQSGGGLVRSCDFDNPDPACETFSCIITNFERQQSLTVTVLAVLDSRFYQSQTQTFSFEPFARIAALDDFERYDNNTNNNIASDRYSVSAPEMNDLNLEIWLPIVGAVLALIIIILIFICLIFCGFFRKKRLEKAKREAEAEYEVRQVPPEQPAVVTGEDKKVEELGEEVEMSKQDPADEHQDIGDASDLQDGNAVGGENGAPADGGEPEKDPEETSL